MRKLLLAILILSIIFVSGCTSNSPGVACTADARICPDGTAVGRVGPNCEFAPCPDTDTARAKE